MGEPSHFIKKAKILEINYGKSYYQLIFWRIFQNEPILESSNHIIFKKKKWNMFLKASNRSGT